MTRGRYWLHITGFWAIVVVQPLFQLLAAAPEFFVAHRAGRTEILLLVAALVLVCPLLLILPAWLAGFAGRRARAAVVLAIVAALSALFAMQAARQLGVERGVVAVPGAVLTGIAASIAYALFAAVRTFATILAALVVVVPAMFLGNPQVKRLVWPAGQGVSAAGHQTARSAARIPVVMLILDELPLVSLLDGEGKIDAMAYPNFAALARDGVWFRNATTVSDYTRWALPAMLSGQWPRAEAAPDAADHPDTLFTTLGRSHRIEAIEAVTRLCPERLCGPPDEPLLSRMRMIASDLRILYLHVLLTEDLKGDLPSLTGDWANFGAAREANRRRRDAMRRQRRENRRGLNDLSTRTAIARRFIAGISHDDPDPTFYFLHTMLSHTPHELLPDGRVNATRSSARPLELPRALPGKYRDAWTGDEWAVAQSYQRHLLQAGFVDTIIGELVARLREQDLYDRSLVIVVADHGIAFQSGLPRRDYTPGSAADIMRVPLLVKLPAGDAYPPIATTLVSGQRVSDRSVETIDLVPTVAEVLGVPLTWKVDGVSLFAPADVRPGKTLFYDSARRSRTFGPGDPPLAPSLERKTALFGGAGNPYRLPRPPRYGGLVGRRLGDFTIADGGGAVEVDFLSEFERVPADGREVPFDVAGRLTTATERAGPAYIAVAVNGVVRAVTRTWADAPNAWLATPPLDAWRPDGNDLQVFVIDGGEDRPVLRRTDIREAR